MKYKVNCHCGAIQAEIEADENIIAHECNCSICRATGLKQVIIPARDFQLLKGNDALALYKFNTNTARHHFCKTCGVKPFYVPRSNPDGYAININCLQPEPASVQIEPFDGVNWEANASSLSHWSK